MNVNFNSRYNFSPKIVSKKTANVGFKGNNNNQDYSFFETSFKVTVPDLSSRCQIKKWSNGTYNFNLYKKSLDSDKPLKVLDLLKTEILSEDDAKDFLSAVTKDEKTASAFIEEITKDEDGNIDPKKSPEIVRTLVNKLGGKRNFETWYCKPGGYLEAFNKYTRKLFQNSESIEELCGWLPNWGAWVLKPKFNKIQEEKGIQNVKSTDSGFYKTEEYTDGFTLGRLPRQFKGKENYRELIESLRFNLNMDDGAGLSPAARGFGFDDVEILDKGKSGKAVLKLNHSKESYVLKLDRYKSKETAGDYFNELRDLTPDSPFLNAMTDYYITKHCPDAASKLYFYDDLTGSSVYEFVQGEKASFISDEAEANTRCDDFKKAFKKLDEIGITFTDFNSNNYVKTKDGIKCIDSGHAVYFDILKPGCGGLTISLPTRTGFNPLEFNGALSQVLEK